MMQCVSITVHGKVQGVYFRKFTQQIALSLELSGFVRNDKSGTVYIEALGRPEKVNKLVEWCSKGPSGAQVTKTEVSEIKAGKYIGFEIRRTE